MTDNTALNNDYWFFLSYSSYDNDENLRRFWENLVAEVRRLALIPPSIDAGSIGFRDKKEIDVGANWRTKLSSALQASRVLLCVYSKAYFASEYCGKEFEVFNRRLNSYLPKAKAGAVTPRLIIPILWDPKNLPPTLPDAVKDIQDKHEDFGDLYASHGLYYLMKIKEAENDIAYNKFVLNMAKIIYEQGFAHQMDALVPAPALEDVSSAFDVQIAAPTGPRPAVTQLPRTAPTPLAKGYDVAWFVYVAGREADYQGIPNRTLRNFYGQQGGYDWKPYDPLEDRIGKIATSVASRNNFQPEMLAMSQNLIDNLRDAETNNTPVVIILDPWALKLKSYTKAMSDLDKNRLSTSIVLVVWNKEDKETSEEMVELLKILGNTFPRSLNSKESVRSEIFSGKDLRRELRAVLKSISDKIMQNPNPQLPIEHSAGSFPKLNVPADSVSSEDLPGPADEGAPIPPTGQTL